ncbi:1917_t:CDS:1 [Gigaspora margarita]|uniref:1917_t:CDS:1 n=1 Tax=Gigaspora margarita TaxID=4874 RepID=A0ABN7V6R4_GIGMA|nr:1917_t:CDS:1 [Gigaspora margarita]
MPPRRSYTVPIPNKFARTTFDGGGTPSIISVTSNEEAYSTSNILNNHIQLELTKHKISMKYQVDKEDKDRKYMKEKDNKDRETWKEKEDKDRDYMKEKDEKDRESLREKEDKDRDFLKEKEFIINNRWNTFFAWLKEIIIIISPTINLFLCAYMNLDLSYYLATLFLLLILIYSFCNKLDRTLLCVYTCCLMVCFFIHKNVDMTKFVELLPYGIKFAIRYFL